MSSCCNTNAVSKREGVLRDCDAVCKASAGEWSINFNCPTCRPTSKGEKTTRCLADLIAIVELWREKREGSTLPMFGANDESDDRAPVVRECVQPGFLERLKVLARIPTSELTRKDLESAIEGMTTLRVAAKASPPRRVTITALRFTGCCSPRAPPLPRVRRTSQSSG